MKTSKGFTIIELLVVIAIIAVLAAVVMVNVTSYISKGKDAAIKANLAQIPTIAATVYDSTNAYTTLSSQAGYTAAITAIESANGTNAVTANIGTSAYCVETALATSGEWCIDSTGYVGATAVCDGTNYNCASE